MSLRRRLVVGLLALVTVVVAATVVVTCVALRSFLLDRLDEQLRMPPPPIVSLLCASPGSLPMPSDFRIGRVARDGTTVATCRGAGAGHDLEIPVDDAARLVRAAGTPLEVTSAGVAVRAVATAAPGTTDEFWVIGRPLTDLDAILGRLALIEMAFGVVALATTAGIGTVGVRWMLDPLQQVTRTARAVAVDLPQGSDHVLHRRVPAAPSDTEVGQLAEAFNRMLDAVQTEVAARQDSEQRMRQFLADASHELRTPLTTLRGYAELLRMRAHRERHDRDGWTDALWRVEAEGTRMARLVDDLLTLARADQNEPLSAEPVRLDVIVHEAVADLRAVHPDRDVSLQAGPDCVVPGRADQLRQVLTNLLANAAVHTRPTGSVRVAVRSDPQHVTVIVDDDGPGLTPREAAHVFDRFWRADAARARVRGGSGLGLPIVDALVTAHGGSIRFDTSPAAGTTVHVRLPRGSGSRCAGPASVHSRPIPRS